MLNTVCEAYGFASKRTTQVQCKYYNEIFTFESSCEAAKWLSQNNTRNKSTEKYIRQSCKSERKKAYEGKIYLYKSYPILVC